MNNKLLTILIVVFLIIVAGAGAMIYANNNNPDKVFKEFLKAEASLKTISLGDVYSGTGTTLTNFGTVDSSAKNITMNQQVSCTTSYSGSTIPLKVTAYTANSTTHLRIDDVSGSIKNQDGQDVDLVKAFSKIKGQWYKVDEPDKSLQSMLDSGVFVFDQGVIAPSYDSEKILKAYEENNVYVIDSSKKTSNGFTFKVTLDRNAYQSMLKSTFPNLSNVDLVLDNIFGKDTKKSFALVDVKNDGTYISATTDTENVCTDLYTNFAGITVSDQPNRISGVSKPVNASEVKKEDITTAKPISQLSSDYVL